MTIHASRLRFGRYCSLSLVLATALYVAFWSGFGHAQSIPGLGGDSSGGPVLVDRNRTQSTALESFNRHLKGRVGERESETDDEVALQAAQVEERFANALETALDSLQGDGLLTAAEVEQRLGELRKNYTQELETVLTAVRAGYPPPPLRQGEELTDEHTRKLLEYTLTVRNLPEKWLSFFGWIIGGLLLAWALNLGANRLGEKVRTGGLPGVGSVLRSLAGPLYLVAIGTGLQLGFDSLWVPAAIRGLLQGSISTILVSALFWFFWNASPGIATGVLRLIGTSYTRQFDNHAHNILLRVIRIIIIVLLVLTVVRVILDSSLSGMLTGLGVLGVALYFILRGAVENIAASFTLFSDQPFRVGDMVIYNDEWGTIEDIGFRSTQFRNFDGYLITIPNSNLIDVAIVNAGARPSIRRRFHIGLTYHTPADKVREAIEIIRDILKDHEGMPEDMPPNVEFQQFGAYDLKILVQYFYAPPDYWEAMALDSKINLAIIEQLEEAGIDIAFPTETHIVEGSHRTQPVLVDSVAKQDDDFAPEQNTDSESESESESGSEESGQEDAGSSRSGKPSRNGSSRKRPKSEDNDGANEGDAGK